MSSIMNFHGNLFVCFFFGRVMRKWQYFAGYLSIRKLDLRSLHLNKFSSFKILVSFTSLLSLVFRFHEILINGLNANGH